MMKKQEREILEQEKRDLVNSLWMTLKWFTPIKTLIFIAIPYLAIRYYGHSLSTFDIVGLAIVFCLLDYPLPLYRLWRINQKLYIDIAK